jgi:predicted metal-dependent HD superfamily phosphohydrolase
MRQEFWGVPREMYKYARLNLLQGYLTRERLFLTDYFFKKYEVAARRNIVRERDSLVEQL